MGSSDTVTHGRKTRLLQALSHPLAEFAMTFAPRDDLYLRWVFESCLFCSEFPQFCQEPLTLFTGIDGRFDLLRGFPCFRVPLLCALRRARRVNFAFGPAPASRDEECGKGQQQ